MIEARGASHAYVYTVRASRFRGNRVSGTSAMVFDVADSDDEAFGRAMKIAWLAFPQAGGWGNHHASTIRISGIGWVGKHDNTKIIPAE